MRTHIELRKIGFVAFALVAFGISRAAAEVRLFHCSDSTMKVDTVKHTFAWINARGKNETAAQGRVQFRGHNVIYGVGNPYPMSLDTDSGRIYRSEGGTWQYAETCKRS